MVIGDYILLIVIHSPWGNAWCFNDISLSSCLRSAGGYNDWPTGRGIFFNKDKTFLVWVNEEDHLRLISMQKGGNLKEVYSRLVTVCISCGITDWGRKFLTSWLLSTALLIILHNDKLNIHAIVKSTLYVILILWSKLEYKFFCRP